MEIRINMAIQNWWFTSALTVIRLMFFINRVGLHYGFTARQLCHHHGTVTSMRSCLLFSSAGVTLAQFEVKMHIYHLTFLPISISSIHLRIHPLPLSYTNVTPDSHVIQFIYWKRTTLIDQQLQMAAKKRNHIPEQLQLSINLMIGWPRHRAGWNSKTPAQQRSVPWRHGAKTKEEERGRGWLAGYSKWGRGADSRADRV